MGFVVIKLRVLVSPTNETLYETGPTYLGIWSMLHLPPGIQVLLSMSHSETHSSECHKQLLGPFRRWKCAGFSAYYCKTDSCYSTITALQDCSFCVFSVPQYHHGGSCIVHYQTGNQVWISNSHLPTRNQDTEGIGPATNSTYSVQPSGM